MEEDGASKVMSHDYTHSFPVDNAVPEDPFVVDILEEYSEELDVKFNTEQVLAYANEKLTRYGSDGGDSCLETSPLKQCDSTRVSKQKSL